MEHDDRDTRWDERVARTYRTTPIDEAAARERLRQRLDHERARRRGSLRWWWEPAGFSGRPMVFAAAALVLLAAGAVIGRTLAPSAPQATAVPPVTGMPDAQDAAVQPVTFAVAIPGALSVSVVGDFNGWDSGATPLRRAALGDLWTIEVAMPPGVHVYAFVVDGERWVPDPTAPRAPDGAFGAGNSVVVVGDSHTS